MSKEAPIKVPDLEKGTITFEQLDKPTQDRFLRNELLVYSILIIVAITLVGIVIGAVTLVVDQEHFNNELYRNGYIQPGSTKIESIPSPGPVFKHL